MKQNSVSGSIGFFTLLDHRIKNLPSFFASSIFAQIVNQQIIGNNIWFRAIPGHSFQYPNHLFPLL
ncbi:hypothetical protein PR202_gb29763 [Eleusine coracana subsp. coracana]|uniref:Uncharacterized protein n=1 Tax=Eleusine coracana subsp. coracana TaxID=191504 RepID=A0AAV5G029_ELECO|nr:hypothetical protein PR202_gb29763 [Eleusine coracana subsp. coracana]